MSSSSGVEQAPLHGDLELTIHQARELPTLLCRHWHQVLRISGPYVAVVLGPPDVTLARTHVVRNDAEAPRWSAFLALPLAHLTSYLAFQVKVADPFGGSDLIGVAYLHANDILLSSPIEARWLPLFRPDGRGTPRPDSAILISATFLSAATTTTRSWRDRIPAYFLVRSGCDVKLYRDAHVEPGEQEGRCWDDLCLAILGAQHLVYVAGWSVHTQVRLHRESMSPDMAEKMSRGVAMEKMSLGQLLKYKSQDSVRVCLLVWDDKTSQSHDRGGIMGTRADETKKFFKHSSVICVLSPRYPSSKLSRFRQKIVGTLYTHHQKCVLVDTPALESTRRITAFVGGLDLCAGRYDTPSHRLFRDLGTVFQGDVYNATLGHDANGPRQPWHDLHCRLDGPAAYDVLRNFEQRWRKATKLLTVFGKLSAHYWKGDALIKHQRIPWILSPNNTNSATAAADANQRLLHVLPEENPECWHAQVFRSVDSGSVQGFPRTWKTPEMEQYRLLCDKSVAVEQSIHTAYIRAIRSAERFIYIENQYFIGSSYAWSSYPHRGAGNLVPMEIALKVAAKIRAGEQFAAYIVIPMWPEGDPSSGPAQEILFWQRQTMEMMYRVIAREIDKNKVPGHPQDYLNFYCLGNREEKGRFMVYVHSKGVIVDDDYVIVGSANINQRSLAGSRDTEIAVGAYQPHQSKGKGNVYRYRMSLWEEHLGREVVRQHQPEIMDRPESPECVRTVNHVARDNWKRYTATQYIALQGHLMRYPVLVSADGKVSALPGHETFPDVGGSILGSTINLPDYLTM